MLVIKNRRLVRNDCYRRHVKLVLFPGYSFCSGSVFWVLCSVFTSKLLVPCSIFFFPSTSLFKIPCSLFDILLSFHFVVQNSLFLVRYSSFLLLRCSKFLVPCSIFKSSTSCRQKRLPHKY